MDLSVAIVDSKHDYSDIEWQYCSYYLQKGAWETSWRVKLFSTLNIPRLNKLEHLSNLNLNDNNVHITFSIMTLTIMVLFVPLKIKDSQHNDPQHKNKFHCAEWAECQIFLLLCWMPICRVSLGWMSLCWVS